MMGLAPLLLGPLTPIGLLLIPVLVIGAIVYLIYRVLS